MQSKGAAARPGDAVHDLRRRRRARCGWWKRKRPRPPCGKGRFAFGEPKTGAPFRANVSAGSGEVALHRAVREDSERLHVHHHGDELLRDDGAIVLLGSLGASRGWSEQSVYASSKAAVRSLARTWTAELGARGIRVNVLSPGATATRPDDENHELAALIPAGRCATPDEIARVAVFLGSRDATYVRGVELFADGGLGQI